MTIYEPDCIQVWNHAIETAAALIRPNMIGEHPEGSGKDDPIHLALANASERILKLKQ